MSNKLTRKGLAVSSGLAIALTSLVGVAPAQAATSYIDLKPESGETWAVFNTDEFATEFEFPFEGANWGLALTNTSGQAFELNGDDDFDVAYAVTSTGAIFDVYADIVNDVVDFDALGAVRVHLGYYNEEDSEPDVDITPLVFDSDSGTSIDSGERFDDYLYATWGDGDFSLGMQVWREAGSSDRSFVTIEPAVASATENVKFYDPARVVATPRIERFAVDDGGDWWLDLSDESALSFSISFSKRVNLSQIDLSDWIANIEEKDLDATNPTWVASGWYDIDGDDREHVAPLHDDEVSGYAWNYGDDVFDQRSSLYVWSEYTILSGYEYRVSLASIFEPDYVEEVEVHATDGNVATDASNAMPTRLFRSASFEVATGTDGSPDLELSVSDAVNSNVDEDNLEVDLRPGTKSFTYSVQLKDGQEDLAESDVPIMFVVTTDSEDIDTTLSIGSSIALSGSNTPVLALGNIAISQALTDEDGLASFTVTHSSATAGEGYEVTAYSLDEEGYWEENFITYEAGYVTGTPSEIEADATIAGGAKVNVAFTVTDQFGQPVSKSGTKALSVLLSATDTDELELAAAVDANGRASFTFDNYLEVGATDLLFAEVITGTVTDPTPVGPQTEVELYNSPAANSVSVAKNATANVTYQDFLTGAGSASKNAAMTAVATTYTGTVLDANGAGIPGAVVKVAGTGFLFRNTGVGNYFENSIDVVADNNGKFSVDFWVHEANATGKTLTVTSGGKTATTTVKTYLPTGLDGNNLKFELVMPKNVVKNTTYALVAKLTDKWGNPVATSTSGDKLGVTIQGLGSVEINSSSDEVSRNFGKDGTATVYLRSVKDIAGPGTVTASLGAAAYRATADADLEPLSISEKTVDQPSTVWDETKFTNVIEVDVEVLNAAPASGKVNVGSFNGKLVVYASGLQGSTISWKVGGVWGKQVATSNFARFDRPTPRRGVTVTVDIYVNGVKQLTKSVVTR